MIFLPIKFQGLEIFVSNDYYKENGMRMPVDLDTAFRIADENDCILPTKEMVDEIWKQADIKLDPKPLKPSVEMTTLKYFKMHDEIINEQLKPFGDVSNKIIAGHKKDILNVNRESKKVKIYGWHRSNGYPIQPPSLVHGKYYADYSHGLRLIKKCAIKNGNQVFLEI